MKEVLPLEAINILLDGELLCDNVGTMWRCRSGIFQTRVGALWVPTNFNEAKVPFRYYGKQSAP